MVPLWHTPVVAANMKWSCHSGTCVFVVLSVFWTVPLEIEACKLSWLWVHDEYIRSCFGVQVLFHSVCMYYIPHMLHQPVHLLLCAWCVFISVLWLWSRVHRPGQQWRGTSGVLHWEHLQGNHMSDSSPSLLYDSDWWSNLSTPSPWCSCHHQHCDMCSGSCMSSCRHQHCDMCSGSCMSSCRHQHCDMCSGSCVSSCRHQHCDMCSGSCVSSCRHQHCDMCSGSCMSSCRHQHCDMCSGSCMSSCRHQHCDMSGSCVSSCRHQHCDMSGSCMSSCRHQHCDMCSGSCMSSCRHQHCDMCSGSCMSSDISFHCAAI